MKVITQDDRVVGVELTRRNLEALLAKLDGNPPNSRCTLIDETDTMFVKAVENAEHYTARLPGAVHRATCEAMGEKH
jgi:hypothetical protein